MPDDTTPGARRSAGAPALLATLPSAAGATAAACGTACAGACAPGVLGLLGLSGSSAALTSWAGWLRPVLLAISVVALGMAFGRAYRRPPIASAGFLESRRFVWLMALVSLGLLAFPYGHRLRRAEKAPPCAGPCPTTPPSTAAREGSPCAEP